MESKIQKTLIQTNIRYLGQEFDVLYLFKQKRFHPYEYMSDFEKFKEESPSTEKFSSSLTDRKISDKEYEHVPNV